MKLTTVVVALLLCGLLSLGIGIWVEMYHYQDCRRVGHTKLYCVLDILR